MNKPDHLKIAICQINPTVGDLKANARKIIEYYLKSVEDYSPDLVVFPECALTGYPPEDLLLKASFIKGADAALKTIAQEIGPTLAIVGTVTANGQSIFNSAVGLQGGKSVWTYSKRILPNYGVFDEQRYFSPGKETGIFKVQGVPMGISVCEDIWEDDLSLNPCAAQARKGARILINISASPFFAGKFDVRYQLLKRRVKETKVPIIYVNMAGGQDELVYDGRSMAMDADGHLRVLTKSFEEDIGLVHFDLNKGHVRSIWREKAALPLGIPEIHQALLTGTRDYVNKNKFKSVILGLSGGIDSALTAALAVEAIGKDRVIGVTMPSRFSSSETVGDAEKVAINLGIKFLKIPIHGIHRAFLKELAPAFKGMKADTTEENIQPRIRGMILMALSNKFGHLVLTTGNKSEISVGYCTLYGDTAGGFAMLKDAPKGMVYDLSRYINKLEGREIIPASTIRRVPTAELKFNQTDQDTLPPYPVLDKIIQGYVEEDLSYEQLLRRGFDAKVLQRVIQMIDRSEYKRRQSPPGIKITPKAFGRDRRMPITNKFTEWLG